MKLIHNARVITLDPARPAAGALLIAGEMIAAVGGDELAEQAGPAVEKIDLQGRVVMPGMTDAHIHLQHYALGLQKIDCETDALQACLERVSDRAASTPPGEWVLGHGWNHNTWGGGWPSAADLDAVAPAHPVYLTAKSLHAAWANSAALRLAGIAPGSRDPKDGQIQRDAQGRPTGILLESAMQLVEQAIPRPSVEQIAAAIEQAQPSLWRMGLTGVHDFDRADCFSALQQLQAGHALRLRVTKSIPLDDLPHAIALGLRSGFGDDWLRIGPVKAFMDGALGPRTAAMFDPYLNEPANQGMLNMDAEELAAIGQQAALAGLSLAVHAIGDRANHEVLDAFEQVRVFERENHLPALRHRIEHVQVLHPQDAGRLAQLGVIASMQPLHAPSDMLMADRFWGERAALAYAWRAQLDAGARLAFGSDAPVESPNPFLGLYAAVTRQRADGSPSPDGWQPAQRISLAEAFSAYTAGPAYAAGLEDRLGRLAPGCLADLVVLDQDPFTVPSARLLTMQASAVMIGGAWTVPL
jgi:predicted amidohydrolase YtcJ